MSPLLELLNTRPSDVADLDDAALLTRVAEHDAEAFEVLYDRRVTDVYSYACFFLGEGAMAESITHDVMLDLWRRPRLFAGDAGPLGIALRAMAREKMADALRRTTRRRSACLIATAD